MTQARLIGILERDCPSTWPRVWGTVYVHRSECLRLVLGLVDELLEDRCVTRARLREKLADAIEEIEEHGP